MFLVAQDGFELGFLLLYWSPNAWSPTARPSSGDQTQGKARSNLIPQLRGGSNLKTTERSTHNCKVAPARDLGFGHGLSLRVDQKFPSKHYRKNSRARFYEHALANRATRSLQPPVIFSRSHRIKAPVSYLNYTRIEQSVFFSNISARLSKKIDKGYPKR